MALWLTEPIFKKIYDSFLHLSNLSVTVLRSPSREGCARHEKGTRMSWCEACTWPWLTVLPQALTPCLQKADKNGATCLLWIQRLDAWKALSTVPDSAVNSFFIKPRGRVHQEFSRDPNVTFPLLFSPSSNPNSTLQVYFYQYFIYF